MSKGSLIILFGLLAAFLPFTGFPSAVKMSLAVFFGIAIMALGFLVRQERLWLIRAIQGERKTDAYTESGIVYPRETQEV